MKNLLLFILALACFVNVGLAHSVDVDNSSDYNFFHSFDVSEYFIDSKPLFNKANEIESIRRLLRAIQAYDEFRTKIYNYKPDENSVIFYKNDIEVPVYYEYFLDKYSKIIERKCYNESDNVRTGHRKYSYNKIGQLIEIIEQMDGYLERLQFFYSENGLLTSFTEEVDNSVRKNSNEYPDFDIYKYKLDKDFNIIEVRGAKHGFLNLTTSDYKIVKVFDYDDNNRLRAVRDFIKPELSWLIDGKNEYVAK